MTVEGGGDKVAAAFARRGSFLRTGVQSGGLAGQGWKAAPYGLPTTPPHPRRNRKTRQGLVGNLPNGTLGPAAGKRRKAGESQVWLTKNGAAARKLGHCENPRSPERPMIEGRLPCFPSGRSWHCEGEATNNLTGRPPFSLPGPR